MRRRRALAVGSIIGAIFAIGSLFAFLQPGRSERIVIAQVGDFFLYAPIYVALDAGLFRAEGLNVEIISAGGDDKVWAAILSGSAQFGVGDPAFVAVSGEQGQPGRVISAIVSGVPFWGITTRPDIPTIRDPAQLRGYTIATFPAPSTAFVLQTDMFRRGGLEPSIRQGAFGALIPMLLARQADIALELEPNVSTAVETQRVRVVYSLADIYPDFVITGLTAAPTYLQQNPETAQRLVCALQRSFDLIREDTGRALVLLQRRFPEIPGSVASEALRRVIDANIIPRTGVVSASAWRNALDVRIQVGDLPVSRSRQEYIDNRFAEFARQQCRAR